MKRAIFLKSTAIVLMISLILGVAATAEAQRGRHMMDRPQTQDYDDQWTGRGPAMMGNRMGMMGPGMGMMGPGMGMMGAQGTPCPIMNQMGHGMGMAGALDLPDLTPEQQNEIRAIQKEMRRKHMETMLDIMDIRDEMMIEMAAARPDPEKIREMQATMSQKQGEMLESTVTYRNRIYDLLSEEQQNQIQEYQRHPMGQQSWGRDWNR
ncbi:MAG: Spy/CpxP family protein refolding chaperone [Desulfosalsimonadaceae bacterium]